MFETNDADFLPQMPVLIVPDWPVPATVRSFVTTRSGGYSARPFDSFNLASHVGDDPERVMTNRDRLRGCLPATPRWLSQVHGTHVLEASDMEDGSEGDAVFSIKKQTVCAVLTADCLPVLLCDRAGTVVAAAHAGWRGLCHGVLEATVRRLNRQGHEILAWLGPAIGPQAFEVGQDVRTAFIKEDPRADQAFSSLGRDKFLCDLYFLARQRLQNMGVQQIFGGNRCTFNEKATFFSYRREPVTGRFATLIWLE